MRKEVMRDPKIQQLASDALDLALHEGLEFPIIDRPWWRRLRMDWWSFAVGALSSSMLWWIVMSYVLGWFR